MREAASNQLFSTEHALLRELSHRINNEYASVISAASLAAATATCDEAKVALNSITELLHQYADVHHALQMPEHIGPVDAAAYLRQLCLSTSRSKLKNGRIRLVLAVNPFWLESDRCWRMGMILHELITNAAKHAFSDGNGDIRVEAMHTSELVECTVQDNGSAPKNLSRGRGLMIINGLTRALNGRFEQQFGPLGSTSTLVFPRRGMANSRNIARNSRIPACTPVDNRGPAANPRLEREHGRRTQA